MAATPRQQQTQGFIIGILVAGAVAAGVFLSLSPSQPQTPPAPPPTPPMPAMAQLPALAPMPSAAPMAAEQRAPMTPRSQADDLFNEVMRASETNDQATLTQMLPGALAAYRSLSELDDDGWFHVAALELAGARYADARATSQTLLAKNPKHLLALAVSMRAAVRAGDPAAARDFAKRLLDAYDSEVARGLPEYQDHGRVLPSYRTEAQAAAK